MTPARRFIFDAPPNRGGPTPQRWGRPGLAATIPAVNIEELETQLRLGRETQTFEVKGCMPWHVTTLAKDILAMANHRDGGVIVIGVQDRTFAREGVDAQIKATYDVDAMRAKMKRFADPPVRFDVDFLTDAGGLEYVVITVKTYETVPVISRANNNSDVYQGVLYYRNSDGPVESAAISNAADMLDLILTASTRTRLWLRDRDYVPASDTLNQQLDAELGDI